MNTKVSILAFLTMILVLFIFLAEVMALAKAGEFLAIPDPRVKTPS